MAIDLTDKVCLITGAGQGIGAALISGFARRGAIVVATDIALTQHQVAALNLAWDVTDEVRAAEVVENVVQRFGRLDVLVANAGTYPRENWDEISPQRWREILAINLDGAWHACQAAA